MRYQERQGTDARRDATSGQFVCFRCPGAGALDEVNRVRILEGQLQLPLGGGFGTTRMSETADCESAVRI
jgi:hypothetical protein